MGKSWMTGMGGGKKDGYGIREEYISTKGVILGFTRDLIINGIPGPRRDPQIVFWTEERVPEPALAYNHTDEDFAYHHRSFIRRWMAIQMETHIGAPDGVPQGPNEEQKEEEHEKGNQDREGCDHPLIQGD